MDTRLLCHINYDLGPEARWLLMQWSVVIGLDQGVDDKLDVLYGRLGLSAQQGKPALEDLKALGYVVCKPVRSGRRGRSASVHYVLPEFRKALEQLSPPVTVHKPEIQSLSRQAIELRGFRKLMALGRKSGGHANMIGQERANMLSPATYWLLAVLLAHAEVPGIVRGLSYGRLKGLTGMTKERLKSQLSKLKKLGLIVRHEPGVLHSQEDISLCSIYIFDIEHPCLMGKSSNKHRIVFPLPVKGRHNVLTGIYEAAVLESWLIENESRLREKIDRRCTANSGKENSDRSRNYKQYQKLQSAARELLPPFKYIEPVTKDILRLKRLGMGAIMKAHIYSYALQLLNNHRKDPEVRQYRVHEPVRAIMQSIHRDCASLVGKTAVDLENSILLMIYALAHRVAYELHSGLKNTDHQMPGYDLEESLFVLNQTHGGNSGLWCLELHHRHVDENTVMQKVVFLESEWLSCRKWMQKRRKH